MYIYIQETITTINEHISTHKISFPLLYSSCVAPLQSGKHFSISVTRHRCGFYSRNSLWGSFFVPSMSLSPSVVCIMNHVEVAPLPPRVVSQLMLGFLPPPLWSWGLITAWEGWKSAPPFGLCSGRSLQFFWNVWLEWNGYSLGVSLLDCHLLKNPVRKAREYTLCCSLGPVVWSWSWLLPCNFQSRLIFQYIVYKVFSCTW